MNPVHSDHFTLQQLAPGVYAALARSDGWAIANAGIIDLGRETLVFDAFISPAAGADLRAAAEALFDRPVRFLVNSHYHNDHVWGNQAFDASTTIIADAETRALFDTAGQEEVDYYGSIAADRLAALQARHAAAADDGERSAITPWITYFAALAATMPILNVRRPTLTFLDRLTLHGAARRAELRNFAGGHTPSDTVLLLPDDGILFAADLLFVETHPYLSHGDPDALLASTAGLADLPVDRVIPGHGPVGTPADFGVQRDYVALCRRAAATLAAAGQTVDDLDRDALPTPFNSWALDRFFSANVAFFLEQRHGAS